MVFVGAGGPELPPPPQLTVTTVTNPAKRTRIEGMTATSGLEWAQIVPFADQSCYFRCALPCQNGSPHGNAGGRHGDISRKCRGNPPAGECSARRPAGDPLGGR